MTLSTREVAILIWGAVFIAWALTVPGVRRSALDVFNSARHWKLLISVLLVIAYLVIVVCALRVIRFWTTDLLKDTIIWGLFSGIALAFSGVRMDCEAPSWRDVLTNQIKAIVFVEYVVNTFTFRLWVELLLVPSLAALATLDAVARLDPKHQHVAKLTRFVLAVSGFAILWFAIRSALSGADAFLVRDAVRDLLLPPVLSLTLLPLVYLFFLASAYEQIFLVLRLRPEKDPSVVRYAKRRLFWHLGIRPSIVRSFFRNKRLALMLAITKDDIDGLLKGSLPNENAG